MALYNEELLNDEERAVMRWQYGILCGFEVALWDLITRADGGNLELIAKGFPNEVNGYKKFSGVSGWMESVRDKAFNSQMGAWIHECINRVLFL